MKLVNYGPGEISDRLTILSLKILVGTEQGKDISHFKSEQAVLLAQIRSRSLNGSWFESVLELAAVNGQLWQAEDALRQERKHAAVYATSDSTGNTFAEENARTAARVMPLAFRIQALNDRRAALVAAINTHTGDHVGLEKL